MRLDLRSWAKAALDSNHDQPDLASAWLSTQRDKTLREQLLRLGAQQVVRSYFAAQRVSALSMATGRVMATLNAPEVAERVATRMARQAFWDAYTLFGMTPIREATKEQLETSAEQRESQAKGELRLAKFERAVARHLTGDQRVCEALTCKDVEALARAI